MDKYERRAKELILDFDKKTQRECVQAIHDWMRRYSEDWRFIATALRRKSKENFTRQGFGIFFNAGFMASTYDAIRREDEAQEIDLDEFYGDSFSRRVRYNYEVNSD